MTLFHIWTTESLLDPMQFAYRPKRGVEDATITLLHLLIRHLEGKGSHARVLFVDFSSAFNTIQPHVLIGRLLEEFKLSYNVLGWILDFLTNRTQRVRINNTFSGQVTSRFKKTKSHPVPIPRKIWVKILSRSTPMKNDSHSL